MKIIFLTLLILNLIIINFPVLAASGVSTSTQSKVEGTMKKTDKYIKESNSELKEKLQSQNKNNKYIPKKLEDYKKLDNVNSKK